MKAKTLISLSLGLLAGIAAFLFPGAGFSQEPAIIAAYANTALEGYPVSNVFDTNSSTYWNSAVYPDAYNNEVMSFQFADVHTINYIRLTPRFNATNQALGFPETFDILYNNGSGWVTARAVTAQRPTNNVDVILALPAPVATSWLMLSATKLGDDLQGNYSFQLAEVRAGYTPGAVDSIPQEPVIAAAYANTFEEPNIAYNVTDADPSTYWSSALRADPNLWEAISIQFSGVHAINHIRLTPRFNGSEALGLPMTLYIYYNNGVGWVMGRVVKNLPQPTETGEIVLAFPTTIFTSWIMIDASELGADGLGNYCFQLAEMRAGYIPGVADSLHTSAFEWTGASDQNFSTGANWIGGAAPTSYQNLLFGGSVVSGIVNWDIQQPFRNIILSSALTQNITINGAGYMLQQGGVIDLSNAGADLTIDNPSYWLWADTTWNIGAGRTLTISASGMWDGAYFTSYPCKITKTGPGKAIMGADAGYDGITTISEGVLQIGNGGSTGSMGPAEVINNSTLLFNRSFAIVPNNISGTGNVVLNYTASFDSIMFSGQNTYSGGTEIQSGKLTLAAGATLGAGAVLVNNNAALGGAGIIAGPVTVSAGGVLQPGLGGTDTSPLTINNTLNLAGTTMIALNSTNAVTASTLTGITTLNLGGALTVANVGPDLVAGNSFMLYSAATVNGSFSAINLPALGSGLTWNFNPSTGVLLVEAGVNPTPTNIVFSVSGSTAALTWPGSHRGWVAQSNSVGIASANSWFDIAGSETVTNLNIQIDPSRSAVFYRLRRP